MKDEMTEIVIEMTKEILDAEGMAYEDIDERTSLYGEGGIFDSMQIVSLVVAIEQEIEDRYGLAVALADEKALSRSSSPYRNVGTLAEYAAETAGAA